ncbi:hypothetical protein PF004_g18778 [Phytophthora fragariae]|uniref:Uncharacterized protein n=1 Tax=Phytophthora fragariae TaxID=53985 RepID=A0A6G0NBH9_9STRA|nr:hypothetical protein PF004_g18778 [Phytophthora fragariae]
MNTQRKPANAHAAYLALAPSCCASSGNAAAVAAAGRGGGADVTSRLPGGVDGVQNKTHQSVRGRK